MVELPRKEYIIMQAKSQLRQRGDRLVPTYTFEVESKQQISDGYHTFSELYHHRMILFSVICNNNKRIAWKSWKHHDGTMYDDYFIVGVTTKEGDYTYHYHKDDWDRFNVKELPLAPEWDGHEPKDITRLLTINWYE